jgi:Holliday junction resolvase RusA-like endonuclease
MKISIPFHHCVSKRDKYTRWKDGRMALSNKYRQGKLAINYVARAQWPRGQDPLDVPLEMLGVVYYPDRRRRDIHNHIQIIADGLEGVCYTNDTLIHRLVWVLGGIDRDDPRIEITILPIKDDFDE